MGQDFYLSLQQEIFSNLPIAAVVFNSFLCLHGGLLNADLPNFLKPLSTLEKTINSDNFLVYQILWNDPEKDSSISDIRESKRGPGAKVFGQNVVNKFCEYNNLMIIRGHEVCETGFEF